MRESSRKIIFEIMLLLSFIGVLVAGYQVYEHYFLEESICDFSASFSCSAVTGSRFGEIPQFSGIAVSVYGLLWFLVLSWLLLGSLKGKEKFKLQNFYTFAWIVAGFVGVLYFLLVELYLLPLEMGELVICPLCTVQHIIIAILLVLSFYTLKKPLRFYLKEVFLEE